ncbi:MAG: restriction endonuclease subunit S, partial [bacterium]|nr:restriction endonuclease subunit S [bacterium]
MAWVESETFDILVANPPYSVAAFKRYLDCSNIKLNVLDAITDAGAEIETCFAERIGQLVRSEGVAAVILPSSLLNKDGVSFIKARESILQNFKLIGIVQLNNIAFGKTGTPTAILFLQKFKEPPKYSNLVEDCIDAIFDSGKKLNAEWDEKKIFTSYLAHINVSEEDYINFITKRIYTQWQEHDYFGIYYKDFLASAVYRKKIGQKTLKKLPEDEKKQVINNVFYDQFIEVEKDKIRYFALTFGQRTVVITSPTGTDDQKKFLGYDWSGSRGQEGIIINNLGGKLFNNDDRNDETTLAAAIRLNFDGRTAQVAEDKQEYCRFINTVDMLNFWESGFIKSLNLNEQVETNKQYSGKYPLRYIDDLFDLQLGKTPSRKISKYWNDGKYKWISIADMGQYADYTDDTSEKISQSAIEETGIKLVPKNTVIMSFKLTIGRTAITSEDIYTNEAIVAFIDKKVEEFDVMYLKIFLSIYNWTERQMNAVKGATLNKTSIGKMRIPILP